MHTRTCYVYFLMFVFLWCGDWHFIWKEANGKKTFLSAQLNFQMIAPNSGDLSRLHTIYLAAQSCVHLLFNVSFLLCNVRCAVSGFDLIFVSVAVCGFFCCRCRFIFFFFFSYSLLTHIFGIRIFKQSGKNESNNNWYVVCAIYLIFVCTRFECSVRCLHSQYWRMCIFIIWSCYICFCFCLCLHSLTPFTHCQSVCALHWLPARISFFLLPPPSWCWNFRR